MVSGLGWHIHSCWLVSLQDSLKFKGVRAANQHNTDKFTASIQPLRGRKLALLF